MSYYEPRTPFSFWIVWAAIVAVSLGFWAFILHELVKWVRPL